MELLLNDLNGTSTSRSIKLYQNQFLRVVPDQL